MKLFRKALVILMALSICLGSFGVAEVTQAATTKISLTSTTVTPGYSCRWFPADNVPGYSLTNGGTQYMSFVLGEKGDKISIGFMKYSTKTNYVWYTGTLSSKSTGVISKTLSGATAYYQPYLTNRNETVYISVKSSSYVSVS